MKFLTTWFFLHSLLSWLGRQKKTFGKKNAWRGEDNIQHTDIATIRLTRLRARVSEIFSIHWIRHGSHVVKSNPADGRPLNLAPSPLLSPSPSPSSSPSISPSPSPSYIIFLPLIGGCKSAGSLKILSVLTLNIFKIYSL